MRTMSPAQRRSPGKLRPGFAIVKSNGPDLRRRHIAFKICRGEKPALQNDGKKCKLTRKLLDGCRTEGYNDRVKSESAFAGCSAETEAGFDTITFLARKVDELGLPCVLTIEGARHKIAGTIVQNTAAKNQKVLTMDSMQSTTSKDAANGTTYLSVMEKNLSVLKQALG